MQEYIESKTASCPLHIHHLLSRASGGLLRARHIRQNGKIDAPSGRAVESPSVLFLTLRTARALELQASSPSLVGRSGEPLKP
nr:hypothetical protein CFP56_07605 [Quercus suber]